MFIVDLLELRICTTVSTMITWEYPLKCTCIPSFVLLDVVSASYYAHLYSYHNVWPKVVDCCFAETTLFTELFTCYYHQNFNM